MANFFHATVCFHGLIVQQMGLVRQTRDREFEGSTPKLFNTHAPSSNILVHVVQEAQLLLGDRATRKHAKDS